MAGKSAVDQMELGRPHQPLAQIGVPGRQADEEEHLLEEGEVPLESGLGMPALREISAVFTKVALRAASNERSRGSDAKRSTFAMSRTSRRRTASTYAPSHAARREPDRSTDRREASTGNAHGEVVAGVRLDGRGGESL